MSQQAPPPPPPGAPPPSYNPNPAGASSASQGFPLWAKIGVGCGCLAILGLIAGFLLLGWGAKKAVEAVSDPATAAELLVRAHPDLELVSSDPDAGTITIREKSSDTTQTFDYSQIQEGNFTFQSSDGSKVEIGGESGGISVTDSSGSETTYTADSSEDGIRITSDSGGEMKLGGNVDVPSWVPLHPAATFAGGMSSVNNDTAQGMIGSESVDSSLEDLESWYKDEFEKIGCSTERSAFEMGGNKTVALNCNQGDTTLAVVLNEESGERKISVTYSGPAQ